VPDTHSILLFAGAGLLLNVTPGPDLLYILGRSVSQGRSAGVLSALGIGAGCLFHVFGAALGLSALLLALPHAYDLVRWAGAAYLVVLGVKALRSGQGTLEVKGLAPVTPRRIFVQGALTNVLNPKVALFFLAFLPQFIDADAPHKALAFLVLGAIFIVNGTLWNLLVAWSASGLGRRLAAGRGVATWLNRALGGLFIALGVRLALSER
jgi:threonine/homoserine/homoserine lactone efflux protein